MTYVLEAPSSRGYVWVLVDLPVWDGTEPNPFDLLAAGDTESLGMPRYKRSNRGSRWGDLLWTTGTSKIMSTRFRDVLEATGATGWKQYDVEIVGKHRQPVEGYVGLAVRGRSDGDDLAHLDGSDFWSFHASDRLVHALREAGVTDFVTKEVER